jgi:glucan phosphoethanolaminetransferase (alkaline phosphatase superfamily)
MLAGYETVFEISQKGFTWWFALVGLVPSIPGACVWWWRKSHEVSWRAISISYAFPAFALLWLCVCTILMAVDYRHLLSAYREGRFSTVEGRVEDFHPMPPQGHPASVLPEMTDGPV